MRVDLRDDLTCIVFDLDGVIVNSEHLWEEGWGRVSASAGVSWTVQDTHACQGKSVPEWSGYLAERTGCPAEQVRDQVVQHVTDAYDRGEVPLLPGAAELVRGASKRVPVGLASSAPRVVIDRVTSRPLLNDCFSVTVSTAEVARGKPSPDVYLAAVERLGGNPSRSFAVEDSSNGIRAASAAGLSVLGIEHRRYPVSTDAAMLTMCLCHSLAEVAQRLFAELDNLTR